MQVIIRFPDEETEQKALGKLLPRFSGKSWSAGETMVRGEALPFLADEKICFAVVGQEPSRMLNRRDGQAPP